MTKIVTIASLALAMCGAVSAARADCAARIDELRAKLHDVKQGSHEEEITKLAEKAEGDDRNGRERLCLDALERAQALLR